MGQTITATATCDQCGWTQTESATAFSNTQAVSVSIGIAHRLHAAIIAHVEAMHPIASGARVVEALTSDES